MPRHPIFKPINSHAPAQRRTPIGQHLRRSGGLLLAGVGALALATGVAHARGGTAKPPTVSVTPLVTVLPPAGPILPSPTVNSSGFSVTGMVQSAIVDGGCGSPTGGAIAGGKVTINGIVITIPTNTIVQFPANTTTWVDAMCGISPLTPALALDGTGGTSIPAVAGPQAGPILPSIELSVAGNIVGGAPPAPAGVGSKHIAALVYFSQQSLNSGNGFISFIDYNDGSIYVSSQDAAGNASELRLLINDPKGRFGRALTSSDARFSVDDANPTIKAAATGYPMCVPRTDPGTTDDPLCPKKNRPISTGGTSCRNFAATGIAVPAGGELPTTAAGLPCSAFVMKAITGMPGAIAAAARGVVGPTGTNSNIAGPTDPDARQQVPFQVGDYITWAGTLVRGGNAIAPVSARPTTTGAAGAGDVIWVHTIDANVGVYTQPATLPSYVAVGEFVIGVDPQPTGAAVAVGAETTARLSLETSVSDIASLVDIYFDDKGFSLPALTPNGPLVPTNTSEYFRWLTLESMTGTLADQAGGKIPFITSGQPFGGGIQTQFTGPQPGRARIRATKVPAISPGVACPLTAGTQGCAVTQSPTRYMRVTVRSLCAPAAGFPANTPATNPGNLDGGAFFSINGPRATLPGAASGTSGVAGSDGSCLQSAQFANGLFSGQYMAPVGEFIFGENTLAGARIIPANVWQLGFLNSGEGGDGSTGPQIPQPW